VLRSGSTPPTGPDTAGPTRRIVRALFLPVLVVLATLPIGAELHPAGADQITDLRSKAAIVAHDLVLEQLQVDAARQMSSVASAKVATDQQAIAQLGEELASDQQAIAHHLRIVQTQAIRTYVNSGSDSSNTGAFLFSGSTSQAQVANEYASLAVGTITTDMARLHTAQHTLQTRQAALEAQRSQDRSDEAHRTAALAQASSATAQLQAEQARVTGRLAFAVGAQQSAQAQAASAAVSGARKLVPRTGSTTATIPVPSPSSTTAVPTPSATTAGVHYPSLSDPALNGFLSCVVQAESGGNYGIVSPDGLYMGGFQFSQPTWNSAAQAAGLGLLVGVPPNLATRSEQDSVAVALFALDGQRPWLGDRCS
jgi:hypothetical protein